MLIGLHIKHKGREREIVKKVLLDTNGNELGLLIDDIKQISPFDKIKYGRTHKYYEQLRRLSNDSLRRGSSFIKTKNGNNWKIYNRKGNVIFQSSVKDDNMAG